MNEPSWNMARRMLFRWWRLNLNCLGSFAEADARLCRWWLLLSTRLLLTSEDDGVVAFEV